MTENRNTRYRSLIVEKVKETQEAVRWSLGIKQQSEVLLNPYIIISDTKKKELKMGHTGKFHAREVSGQIYHVGDK